MKLVANSVLSRSIFNLTPRVVYRSYSMIPFTPSKPEATDSISDHHENDTTFLKSLYDRNDSHGAEYNHHQAAGTQGSTHVQHTHAEDSSSHESSTVNTVFED
ncbi:hypothetical protein Unana1_07170 [Umbelopsis nana]